MGHTKAREQEGPQRLQVPEFTGNRAAEAVIIHRASPGHASPSPEHTSASFKVSRGKSGIVVFTTTRREQAPGPDGICSPDAGAQAQRRPGRGGGTAVKAEAAGGRRAGDRGAGGHLGIRRAAGPGRAEQGAADLR